jgi:protein MpaA
VRPFRGRAWPPLAVAAVVALAIVAAATRHHGTARATTAVVGHSVERRPIRVVARGEPSSPVRVLVVGCVHGNECAGRAVTRTLESLPLPDGVALWIVDDANPDGAAAGTRQNARGVDLNRNFPWRWRPIGRRGDVYYSGPRPLSEPESRLLAALVLRVRPTISVWFHQHLALVDASGGDVRLERRYARLVGLPLRRLPRYPGSAVGWENHRLPGSTAFVVELPAGKLEPAAARRYAEALLRIAGRRRGSRSS